MTTVLKSSLLFIDSDYSLNGEGDSFEIDLPSTAISCASQGQFIRMYLQEFCGYRNFYNVNATNNSFLMNINGLGLTTVGSITPSNYETYFDIATNFAGKVAAAINAAVAGATYTVSTVLPAVNITPSSTSNRILDVLLLRGAGTNCPALSIETKEVPGQTSATLYSDVSQILGSQKITTVAPAVSLTGSFTITFTAVDIRITGFYPMQRSTAEHLYLRTSLVNNNLGSKSTHTGGTHGQDVSYTNILAKIPVQAEFINYSSDSGQGYFCDIPNQNLSHFSLTVTDSKNRRLPQVAALQGTIGNMNYSFVLRVDVIAYGPSGQSPNALLTPKIDPSRTNLVGYLDNGAAGNRRRPF